MRLRGHAMARAHRSRRRRRSSGTRRRSPPARRSGRRRSRRGCWSRAAFSFNRERYDNLYQDGHRQSAARRSGTRTSARATTASGTLWNASSAQLGNYPDRYNVHGRRCRTSPARTASRSGCRTPVGPYRRYNNANARPLPDLSTTAAALQVTVLNTPLEVGEYLDANLGVYAQDSWSVNRLRSTTACASTTSAARRRPGPRRSAGFAQSIAAYDDIEMPTWNDLLAALVGRSTTCPATARRRSASATTSS